MSILSIQNVYKSFKDIPAVQDLSLELQAGTIFGLLGPNGAGKTTTIRMIMDIIIPDRGQILVNGKRNTQEQLDQVGYLPEERGLYRKMKVGELLSFLAEMKGLRPSKSKEKITHWLKRFDLLEWQHKKLEALSKGMQQKVQFIATIIHEPQLIILDEPFTGLDPINADLIKEIMIEQKNRGAAIIFSTHMMEQVEKLCDAICLINEGKAVLNGKLKTIKKNFSRNAIRMEFEGEPRFLQDHQLVKSYQIQGNWVEIQPQHGVAIQKILQIAIQEVTINRFEIMEPSLHEIFVETVTKQREEKTNE
ncbi:MAG: ATP-binding cassette domain-containing protein [candidate division KSB1 bacterium]|nr:ATP-binding cassette domain-containing protein [candidate division KSB1 bacterium]